MVVRLVDADVTEVAVFSVIVHVDLALVAEWGPILISLRHLASLFVGARPKLVDFRWDAWVTHQSHEEAGHA